MNTKTYFVKLNFQYMLTWVIKQLTRLHYRSPFQQQQAQPGPGKLKFLKFPVTTLTGSL